jgi:deoxyribonuclease IV
MKFGAHISPGGSLPKLIEKAQAMTVDCFQMFASPPSNWNKSKYDATQMAEFKALVEAAGYGPNFFHAIYLLNFGTENPELLQKSIDSLTHYLTIAPPMGIRGAIFHTGSHKGLGFEAVKKQVSQAFDEILANTPEESWLIIENNAGQGNLLARDATEIARLIDGVKQQDRVKVCLDTCHAFASGTDWRVPEQVETFVAEYERLVGWDKVVAIHANDSKFEVGFNKDRHENIGEGYISEVGFRNILHHPKFQEKAFLLEVPGFTNEGPDKPNLDRLRSYAK